MAIYTTEVRTVCEQFAGMTEHAGLDDVELAIAGSWEQIFGGEWDIYDPEYRAVLCRKILRHYWMREIGAETVGLWVLWLRTRMEEIMPYYNQLYKSAMLEFNPMHDYELTHVSKRTNDGNTTSETESSTESESLSESEESSESTSNREHSNQNVNKFSDTPQGMLENVVNGTYLTSATVDDGSGTAKDSGTASRNGKVTGSGSVSGTSKGTGTSKSTEDYTLTISGKSGGKSYSKLLKEFRDTMLNIDMMIIENLHDLFMGLWA